MDSLGKPNSEERVDYMDVSGWLFLKGDILYKNILVLVPNEIGMGGAK